MVTNYPRQLAMGERPAVESPARGIMARLASRLSQALCGLTGHDAVLHFEGKRVMMRCTSCGHHTPGIEVSGHGPQRRFEGDAARHQMGGQPRLVLRKIA
jgi:hypothetical protein